MDKNIFHFAFLIAVPIVLRFTLEYFSFTRFRCILQSDTNHSNIWSHTDKKENEMFLIHVYKEFHMGSVSKSYMRKGFLIYEKMRKYLSIFINKKILFPMKNMFTFSKF